MIQDTQYSCIEILLLKNIQAMRISLKELFWRMGTFLYKKWYKKIPKYEMTLQNCHNDYYIQKYPVIGEIEGIKPNISLIFYKKIKLNAITEKDVDGLTLLLDEGEYVKIQITLELRKKVYG